MGEFVFEREVVIDKSYRVFIKFFDKLFALKEIVVERINSKAVREYGWYDMTEINAMAETFYCGKYENSKFLFNWLSVDFWREKLTRND